MNATTVAATGSADADIMNMSMHSAGMTITGVAEDDVITGTSGADTITGGTGADTITGGEGDDDFVFSTAATNGADTITAFVSTEDDLDLQALTLMQGADAQTDLLTAADGGEASVVTAAFATGQANADALGVIVVTDEAAGDWADVAAVIEAALTVDATAANNSTVAIIVDNGTDTRVYNYTDVTDLFDDTDDLTLIATISDIETAGFATVDFIA